MPSGAYITGPNAVETSPLINLLNNKSTSLLLAFAFSIASVSIASAQNESSRSAGTNVSSSANLLPGSPAEPAGAAPLVRSVVASPVSSGPRPFSKVSLGVSISPLGVGFSSTTNLTRHINIRALGNFLNLNVSNFEAQGFNVNAKLNMASAGAAVDYYPFHNGFRLSPGLIFYNHNATSATFVAEPGTSFTLNDYTYYSASGTNAVHGIGNFGIAKGSPAFTATTGWGNAFPRSGRHITFPFEIGAAFMDAPTVDLKLTGIVCDAHGQNCVDVATDPSAQANLVAQIQKYKNDLEELKFYPIVSFGVAYNFTSRSSRWSR